MVSQRVDRSQRLAWLEGIRILAVALLLLYHAQMRFTGYAYTPQPTGLGENLHQLTTTAYEFSEQGFLIRFLSVPAWFGFQWIDVFILMSGLSLILSLKDKPLEPVRFLTHRLARLLWPFWTIAWLAYPILWAIAVATDTYFPKAWHVFVGLSFPLVYTYNGELLMSTSGPWWLLSLLLSFALLFPFLWKLQHRWGSMNLLGVSLLITVGYRALAIFVLGGHPSYVIWDSPAGWQPFALFLAKLSTFVIGMVIGQAYLHTRGPAWWPPQRALLVGLPVYGLGFICQFYYWGWVLADVLLPVGLFLCSMALFQFLANYAPIAQTFVAIGSHTYSYFLLYGLVVDRMLQILVQGEPTRYALSLPVMVGGTLILAMIADYATPLVRRVVTGLLKDMDYVLTTNSTLERRIWDPRVGDEVSYQGEAGWTVLKVEKLWDEQEFFLCQVSDGRRLIWVNENDLEPAETGFR